ncbi:MAG: BamA/TamA family outer membrane protein [Gemmatimonadota bacterium]|nr:BamA/TamA family outer membrane protein [Gemmatimonadota bacterium]
MMRRRGRGMSRCLLVAAGATLLAGCGSLVHREPIPDPFPADAPFGEIVTEIRYEGNEHTRESVIRDNLETEVGEPYTEEDVVAEHNRLFQLGVFTSLQFLTEPAPDGTAVIVSMREVNPYLPSISFSITQENGLAIGPSISAPNLFGRGMKSSLKAQFGGATNFEVRLRDPWRLDSEWYGCCYDLLLAHRIRYNKLDDFDERSTEFSAQWLYTASERIHVGPRVTWVNLSAAEDSLGNVPPVTLDADHSDRIPGLGLVAEYDSRNLSVYPTRGWYIQVDGMQNGGWLGGPADYFRFNLDARRYYELAGPTHSLALYSLLTMTSGEVGVDVPVHQDFGIGGTNSVRGWSLGSREGKNQLLGTAEYWFNVVPLEAYRIWFIRFAMGLQIAAFADVGTAWNTSSQFRQNWIGGGGAGLRLVIPQTVMVRFDLAFGEPAMGLIFSVGGNEKAFAQKQRVR